MPFLTVIYDDTGRELATLLGAYHRYVFPDGSTMFVQTTPAWCLDCRAFSMVEELVSPDVLELRAREGAASRSLGSTDHPNAAARLATIATVLEKLLGEAQRWRTALRHRASPPRCLECAGHQFVPVPYDDLGVPHPTDRRRLIHAETDAHVTIIGDRPYYDTEGLRLPPDKVPARP